VSALLLQSKLREDFASETELWAWTQQARKLDFLQSSERVMGIFVEFGPRLSKEQTQASYYHQKSFSPTTPVCAVTKNPIKPKAGQIDKGDMFAYIRNVNTDGKLEFKKSHEGGDFFFVRRPSPCSTGDSDEDEKLRLQFRSLLEATVDPSKSTNVDEDTRADLKEVYEVQPYGLAPFFDADRKYDADYRMEDD
jgi:hypothetical protein